MQFAVHGPPTATLTADEDAAEDELAAQRWGPLTLNVAYPHRYTRLSRIWEDPPGWLTKVMILKFGSGGMLRGARTFFLAVIITEIAVVGVSTIVSFVTGVPTGYVFLSL